ncbi:hypothetical protein L7F22_066640 [Adiantum nelumboides]|nr:hypothetical protein [Adiantum nelumboides]
MLLFCQEIFSLGFLGSAFGASPRTELYEYAKALGNPQFMLLPFQPFKLLYAYMLVEVGKISEARRYCQAVSKALKNVGRSSQIEFCRQTASDLEERLRMHSQGGYNLNSATGKLVGKFIGTLDNTLHRIIGGLPPRQASEPSLNRDPGDWFSKDSKAVDSTKSCQGNAPNRSVQTYLGIFSNRQMDSPSRSVSEPNLSGSREKKEDVAAASLQDSQVDCGAPKEKKNEVHRIGYLGRWISTAVSFMKPNTIKGDLGDDNKFYYNTELKRWVEEGAEQTVEEMTLPPPPVTSSFESNARNASQFFTSTESPGVMDGTISSLPQVPLLPPKGNHYSARGRLNGVQSRYVDTFNKKGTLPAKITNSPVVPTPGWVMVPSPTQFFMPVQAETSTNNATEVSEEELLDHANSSTAHTSTAQNIVAPKENEVALPNDTLSSATTVSSINKHVGVNSITGVDNSLIVPAQGVSSVSEGAQFYSQSLTRGTTWLGKAPRFFATETSINHMLSSCLPDDGNVESGVMLDSYMRTAEYPLPVPATIQLHDSAVGVENGFFNRSVEYAESLLPHDINKDSLTNMQEVEL